VNAPVVRDHKNRDVFEHLRAEGFTRVKVDGEQRLLDEESSATRSSSTRSRWSSIGW
jgi:excinuclease UvrABC ATPase subunit